MAILWKTTETKSKLSIPRKNFGLIISVDLIWNEHMDKACLKAKSFCEKKKDIKLALESEIKPIYINQHKCFVQWNLRPNSSLRNKKNKLSMIFNYW